MGKRLEILPLFDLKRVYPYNLAYDIFEDEDELYLVNPKQLINVVANELSEREATVIFGYYGDHTMTLDELAEEFGVTRERIRQIKRKALRKLGSSKRVKMYTSVSREKYNEALEIKMKKEASDDKPKPLMIAELELSVRTFNAVTRYLYHKKSPIVGYRGVFDWPVDDLLGLSLDDLMNIRNLGKRSLAELLATLKERANITLVDNVLTKVNTQEESK